MATAAGLSASRALAVDSNATLHIASLADDGSFIRHVTPDGRIDTFATVAPLCAHNTVWGVTAMAFGSNGQLCVALGVGRIGTIASGGQLTVVATVGRPLGPVVDAAGNMITSDEVAHTVVRMSPPGATKTIGGTGQPGKPGSDSGAARSRRVNQSWAPPPHPVRRTVRRGWRQPRPPVRHVLTGTGTTAPALRRSRHKEEP